MQPINQQKKQTNKQTKKTKIKKTPKEQGQITRPTTVASVARFL